MKFVVKVSPNARENKIQEWLDDNKVSIKITAPATQGKANSELIRFLSKKLSLAQSLIDIPKGVQSKIKTIETPLPLETVRARLEPDN